MNWTEEKICTIIFDILKVTKTEYRTAIEIMNNVLNRIYDDARPAYME